MGVNLSRLSLGAAMLAMALLASGCASTTSTNTSFESYLEKAQQGDAGAQYIVGLEYSIGSEVPKDEKKYLYWMRKSADQGASSAQYNLGDLYKNGEGVKRDYKKAIYWYSKAAEQGHRYATLDLGALYKNGEGVRDYKKAIYWYSKAAERGDINAHNTLGALYKNGEGVKRDYKKAIYWYSKAAERGDINAQNTLGALYKNGEGVKRDYKKAIYWYRKAAERRDRSAQNALFNLIKERITRGDKRMLREQIAAANGQDAKVAKASKALLEKLLQSGAFIVAEEFANQGKAEAQFMLGENYRLGKGVKKNVGLAIFWYKKAAEQGLLKAEGAIAKLAN